MVVCFDRQCYWYAFLMLHFFQDLDTAFGICDFVICFLTDSFAVMSPLMLHFIQLLHSALGSY